MTPSNTPAGGLTETEYAALVAACRALPPAKGNYHISDFVDNLLLTVVDFQTVTQAVVKAMEHFRTHCKDDASSLSGLKKVMAEYPDDKTGNTALAQRLWGYNLWTRAGMLRRLVEFFAASLFSVTSARPGG